MAKKNYKKLVNDMLNNIDNPKPINEGRIRYDEAHNERMLPQLEEDLRERKHSLGDHPIFPESDELHFEEKLVGERFSDIVREVKRHFNVNEINNTQIMQEMMPMVGECMKIESSNKKKLEELAVNMIRDEYNIPESVEIVAELTPNISLDGAKINAAPQQIDEVDFDSHEDIANANKEVHRRRFLNAINQGAAMKTNHMFHLADKELSDIDPTLPTKYGKMMSAADYMYYIIDNIDNSAAVKGGVVRLELPKEEGGSPKIIAQATVFPVLIHELVKGVMELLSSHGLPEDPKTREYVLGKADYLKAEPWDMRLGPALWERLTSAIPDEDFNLKHHLYADLASLPVDQFNETMKEVMAKTKKGNDLILEMIKGIKVDLQKEDFDRTMDERRMEHESNTGYIDDPNELDSYWNNLGL